MDKSILNEYIDACELIKDTEREIEKLRKKKKTVVQTSVSGSNPEFPYNPMHFKGYGTAFSCSDDAMLRMEERLLEEQRAECQRLKMEVQAWLNTIPKRMNRIIRYRIFEGMSWEKVADRMGRKATGDSIRMEFNNFMKREN